MTSTWTTRKRTHESEDEEWKLGESVLTKWKDSNTYPAVMDGYVGDPEEIQVQFEGGDTYLLKSLDVDLMSERLAECNELSMKIEAEEVTEDMEVGKAEEVENAVENRAVEKDHIVMGANRVGAEVEVGETKAIKVEESREAEEATDNGPDWQGASCDRLNKDRPRVKKAKRVCGRRCMAYGCDHQSSHGYFMHKMPGKMPRGTQPFSSIQRQWIAFISRKRKFDEEDAREYSCIVLCSGHFKAEDYVPTSALMFEQGLRSKVPDLKAGAVPSKDKAEHPFPFAFPVSTASPVVSSPASTSTTSSTTTLESSSPSSNCTITGAVHNTESCALQRGLGDSIYTGKREAAGICDEYDKKVKEERVINARRAEEERAMEAKGAEKERKRDIRDRSKGEQCKAKNQVLQRKTVTTTRSIEDLFSQDPGGFTIKHLPEKGRTVFTTTVFEQGAPLLAYGGELIDREEGEIRDDKSKTGFRFYFPFKGKKMCRDASFEPSEGPQLGRLVNHGRRGEVNCRMKVVESKSGQPELVLFSMKRISENEELLYDYGVPKHFQFPPPPSFRNDGDVHKGYMDQDFVCDAGATSDCSNEILSQEGEEAVAALRPRKSPAMASGPTSPSPAADASGSRAQQSRTPQTSANKAPNSRESYLPPSFPVDSDSSDSDCMDDLNSDFACDSEESSDCSEELSHVPAVLPKKTSKAGQKKIQASPTEVLSSSEICGRNSRISVMKTDNAGGRKYDKVAFCMVCGKSQKKLSYHLRSKHASDKKVAQYMATEPGKEKDRLLTLIRNKGNHIHNYKVIEEGHGELIVIYRPSYDANPRDYLPCNDCLGWYAKSEMWKHCCIQRQDTPADDTKKKRRGVCAQSRLLMPPLPNTTRDSVSQSVLSGLNDDEIKACIMNDELFLELAVIYSQKVGHDQEQHNHVRNKLRELARLVLHFRSCTGNNKANLMSLISPHDFMTVIKATKKVASFDEETRLFDTPSLALKLEHTLRKAAYVLLRKALIDREGDAIQKSAEKFIKLLDTCWGPEISKHALRTLNQRKHSKPKLLSLTSDVVDLTRHLEEKSRLYVRSLSTETSMENQQAWRELTKVILTHLIVFNRRRQGKISKMTLQDYKQIKKGEYRMVEGQLEMLKEWEKHLVNLLWRVEVVGKRGRTVPILMTECMKSCVDALVAHRDVAGVNPVNKYVFAVANVDTTSHIRGSDALRELSQACRAKNPATLRSTRLRKHVATMTQLMSLRDHEIDAVANFMGHDIRIHRDYYRLPDAAVQVAKMSKILFAMEGKAGNPVKLIGTVGSLDDLELDRDEELDTGEQGPESGDEDSASDTDSV